MKTIENKLFKNKPPTQVEVSVNSAGEVLVFTGNTAIWLDNTAALDLATWILDNVSEEENE